MVYQAQKAAITTRALFLLEKTFKGENPPLKNFINQGVVYVTPKIGSILSQCYKVGE